MADVSPAAKRIGRKNVNPSPMIGAYHGAHLDIEYMSDQDSNAKETSGGGRVLGLCLTNWSFGEASLGLRLLRNSQYEAAHFVTSPLQQPLFSHNGLPTTNLAFRKRSLNQLAILSVAEQLQPTEILLVDALTFCESERVFEFGFEFLFSLGVPVSAVDIYACDGELGDRVTQGRRRVKVFEAYEELVNRLDRVYRPCPIYDPQLAREPGVRDGVVCYSAITTDGTSNDSDSQQQDPGVADRASRDRPLKVVMTVASWEEELANAESQKDTKRLVRAYLVALLEALHDIRKVAVDLIGAADESYLPGPSFVVNHHGKVAPEELTRILQSADLFLSTNIIAATIGKALAVGCPVACVYNSETRMLDKGGWRPPDPKDREIELPPFWLCPIGWYQFLNPLLRKSRYLDCLRLVELGSPVTPAARSLVEYSESGIISPEGQAFLKETLHLPPVVWR
jgi:Family of unknown function (DUF6365)